MVSSAAGNAELVRLRVVHETHYDYANPVTLSRHLLHLTPRSTPYQQLTAHRIAILPHAAETTGGSDYFGNPTSHAVITAPHQALSVLAESTVESRARAFDPDTAAVPAWEEVRDMLEAAANPATLDAAHYLFASPHITLGSAVLAYAADAFARGAPLLPALRELTRRIHDEFKFDSKATSIATPIDEVLELRRGVCQDFAHLMIGCLRSRGLAARYVSGYILTMPPPGQARLIGSDASHAWVSVYCPRADGAAGAWVDFDPTNNCIVERDHITLGWGRDFGDVTPIRGVTLGGGEQSLNVQVTVSPQIPGDN